MLTSTTVNCKYREHRINLKKSYNKISYFFATIKDLSCGLPSLLDQHAKCSTTRITIILQIAIEVHRLTCLTLKTKMLAFCSTLYISESVVVLSI